MSHATAFSSLGPPLPAPVRKVGAPLAAIIGLGTLVGLILGNLLGGIAVIETVFTLPGLGRLLVVSIYARDYPVVQGCLLFTAVIYVLVNLIVDLCYPLFDPRVSAE